jgi:hypothetical protein
MTVAIVPHRQRFATGSLPEIRVLGSGANLVAPRVAGPRGHEDIEQGAERDIASRGHGDREICANRVAISTTFPGTGYVSVVDQLGDDPLGRSLRDVDRRRDVPHARTRVVSDTEQHEAVVGKKRKRSHVRPS